MMIKRNLEIKRPKAERKGAALLVVLFVVMTITIVSLGFLSRSNVELACGRNMAMRTQMDYLADSAIEHAGGLILNPEDINTGELGYWSGAVRQQLVAGSDDYYDVSVVRDDANSTPQWIHYLITCSAYREKGGEKVGQRNLSALLLVPAEAGPIGWWKLDETSGLTAADSSGNGNDGALTNMAGDEWTTGQVDGALEFDGDNDHIAGIGNCPTGNYTVAGWAKDTGPAEGDGNWSVFYCAEQEIWFGVDRGESPRIWLDAGGNGKGANMAAGTWTRDVWHHIAATWDGTDIHLYLDGVDMPITVYGTPENAQAKAAVIGAWSKSPDEVWYGLIDDVRLYDRALTADEIATLANH